MHRSKHYGRIVSGALLAVAAGVPGCLKPTTVPVPQIRFVAATQPSEEDLQNAIADFDDLLTATIKTASTEIATGSQDPAVRRSILLWQMQVISASHTALEQSDPLKAFLDLWTLSVRMSQCFKKGSGRQAFGERQEVAVNAATQLEAEIERIGQRFVPAERFAKMRAEVEAFAAAHPLRAGFSNAVVRTNQTKEGGQDLVAGLVGIPLAPFRAMEGVDRGAQAIRGFTVVADRFTDVVEQLPESLRWQIELLLLEMQESPVVSRFLTSAEQLSVSAANISATADKLPERLRAEGGKLVEDIDARQAALQQTLERAEKVTTTIERTIGQVNTVAGSIDQTARSVTETGAAWQAAAKTIGETVKDLGHRPGASTAPASTQPFDINDYRRTADALTETARQVQQLAGQVQVLIDSPRLVEHIQDVDTRTLAALDHAATRTRGATDHLIWRLGQLAVFVFALAMLYRLLAPRLTANRAQTRPPAEH